ncbi:MAG: cohesin domain-containing protein [candidate division KSB1 bacterium]|nr:cohesin domain-containing protein [candidate division KSB1 bacterium]
MFLKARILCIVVILIFLVVSLSCSLQSPGGHTQGQSSIAARISFNQAGLTPASFDSLVITITGDGISPIRDSLLLDGVKGRARINVPANKDLLATAVAYRDTRQVMSGADSFRVSDGETVPLSIMMNFLVPTIIVSPPDSTLSVGQSITLYLAARQVVNMATFGAQVQFDPAVLTVQELGREDAFLKSNAGNVNQLLFSKDNSGGTVDVVFGIFPASAAVTGQGTVGRIVFTAVDTGITDLSVRVDHDVNSNYALFDQNANLMYAMGLGGRITIQ